MSRRIKIYGTTRHDLNGKLGVATDFHRYIKDPDTSRDRYTVLLDSGEQFKIRPSRLRFAPGDLRFEIGSRVECARGSWVAGSVIAHNYREPTLGEHASPSAVSRMELGKAQVPCSQQLPLSPVSNSLR